MKTLSICIPTFNRVLQLEELINSLLAVNSNDFEVVVTNNCSTDDTLKMLNSIDDERLVIYNNQSPEPGLYNMIVSIFNAKGKYALYCNDRDIIYTDRLLAFIEFLKSHDYAFLHISKCYGNPSYSLTEYEKGFDSLIHHPFSNHPTGMVFNVDIMNRYLSKEHYRNYIDQVYTFCFLKREIAIYGPTAEYDNYLWDERPSIYKVRSASGSVYKGKLFFDTEQIIIYMEGVFKHLINNPYFLLTAEQQKAIIIAIFTSYAQRLMYKKRYYGDNRECAHYGIKSRFISYFEMKKDYGNYFKVCDEILKSTIFYDELSNDWNRIKKEIYSKLFKDCIRYDKYILSTKLRRTLDPHYTR